MVNKNLVNLIRYIPHFFILMGMLMGFSIGGLINLYLSSDQTYKIVLISIFFIFLGSVIGLFMGTSVALKLSLRLASRFNMQKK